MKDTLSTSNEINFDEALLYTPGRGRNTWSIYFLGQTDEREAVSFTFRLNISSLPFGFRYLKMYDTILAVTMANEQYVFGRDFGEIKKKKQFRYDTLFFEGNTSRLQGSFDMLDLTAFISNGSVDVAMDFIDENRMVGTIEPGDFMRRRENIMHYISAGNMDCQGMVTINGTDHNIRGAAWVEKKYIEFPKGRVKNTNTKILKINFVPENLEIRFTYISVADNLSGEEKSWLTVIEPEGNFFTHETSSDVWKFDEIWISPHTGKKYPLSLNINLKNCIWEASVITDLNEQEVYSSNQRNTTGEYIGSGHFKGTYKGIKMKGVCSIEISGSNC